MNNKWTARRRAGGNHHHDVCSSSSNSNNGDAATSFPRTDGLPTIAATSTVLNSTRSPSPKSRGVSVAVGAMSAQHHDGLYDNRFMKGRSFPILTLLAGLAGAGNQGKAAIAIGLLGLVGMILLILRSESDRSLRWQNEQTTKPRKPLSPLSLTTNIDGSIKPVLLKGIWTRPTNWEAEELMSRVGHYPQYVKDVTVQPFRRNRDRRHTQDGVGHKNKKSKNDIQGEEEFCILPGIEVSNLLVDRDDVLFFTNNKENEGFMKALRGDYTVPEEVKHITGFEVFSALGMYHSHSFHSHGESWLGQVEGRRMWWFVPPTEAAPPRVNACRYLDNDVPLPVGAVSFLQNPGDVMWFPKDWYHATCALDGWTVGIGRQQGRTIRQRFPQLPPPKASDGATPIVIDPLVTAAIIDECLPPKNGTSMNKLSSSQPKKSLTATFTPPGGSTTPSSSKARTAITVNSGATPSSATGTDAANGNEGWKWFDGDLNAYYNSLEKDEQRDPKNVGSYAIHRWLGPNRTTEEHYRLVHSTAERYLPMPESNLKVLDGGCGLGSGLMWMENRVPQWDLTGYTVSDEQYKFITQSLPPHKFHARLQSYNDLDVGSQFDFIYSIEALIHSDDMASTLKIWTHHLAPGGIITIIDDFLAPGEDRSTEDMQSFAKSWIANSLVTIDDLRAMADRLGLDVVENRDLLAEYDIIRVNYKNRKPNIQPFGGRTHQGWMGSKWRQRLTVEGRILYNMIVLKKKIVAGTPSQCAAVPFAENEDDGDDDAAPTFVPQVLMTGRGKDGGQPMTCISGWYCCDKGTEWYDDMTVKRTEKKVDYLHLDRNLFGHYMEVFPRQLNLQYDRYLPNAGGRFLDIGGTGSTSVGMTQVLSKFQHFAGQLEYWKLDSDSAAKNLDRTLFCDVEDCPEAETCGFDVTFSHTVLEHAARPWLAFDTIARITKKGGLTMHLVPWSYQYHATPDDNFRFSHTALKILLEDRGFDVLEVGYDLCTKPEKMLTKIDE
jgi:SAM-dependent methyltransferase